MKLVTQSQNDCFTVNSFESICDCVLSVHGLSQNYSRGAKMGLKRMLMQFFILSSSQQLNHPKQEYICHDFNKAS